MAKRCAIAAIILPAAALPAPALASTLISNIAGITVNRAGQVDQFTGIVVDDEGRVAQLLDFGDEPAAPVDYEVDGEGRTVLPGFVDAHLRLSGLGFAAMMLDLAPAPSLEEALSRLAAYGAAHPDRPWIIGRGWRPELAEPQGSLTAAALDAVIGERPVWLERADGGAGWANSAALAAAGITAATRDPAGGRIERLAGGRVPTGVLTGSAAALVTAAIPPPLPEDRDTALYGAQQMLLAQGITAVADMGTTIEDWMSLRRAGDAGWLQIRVMAYAGSVADMLLIGGPGPTGWLYDDRLRLNGVRFELDGVLTSRAALLKAPYADDPRGSGLPLIGGTQLRNGMSRAALDDFQVAISAVGDAANAEALSAIEDLAPDFGGDRRWRIELADVVDPADMARYGQHAILAVMAPSHQLAGWQVAEARLGQDRLAGAYAWRSLARAGASLAFGSDAPVEGPDPLAAIAAAISPPISPPDPTGAPAGGWQPQEAITREAALAAVTAGAAYAGFAEGRFGALAVGERADFVMLSGNPLDASAAQIREIRVVETWVAGRQVYDGDTPAPAPNATP